MIQVRTNGCKVKKIRIAVTRNAIYLNVFGTFIAVNFNRT